MIKCHEGVHMTINPLYRCIQPSSSLRLKKRIIFFFLFSWILEPMWLFFTSLSSSFFLMNKRDTSCRNTLKTPSSFQTWKILPSYAHLKIFLLSSQEMWNLLAVLMYGFTRKRKMQKLVFLWQWSFSSYSFTKELWLCIPHWTDS